MSVSDCGDGNVPSTLKADSRSHGLSRVCVLNRIRVERFRMVIPAGTRSVPVIGGTGGGQPNNGLLIGIEGLRQDDTPGSDCKNLQTKTPEQL